MEATEQKELVTNGGGYLALINQVAANPSPQSVEVLERMMAMQERWEAQQARKAYNEAMVRLQMKLPVIEKNGKIVFEGKDKNGNHYRQETPFARYEDIDKAIRPLLKEEGFVITFTTEESDRVKLVSKISHIGGHSETATMMLPLDTSGSKNNLQAAGSTMSYGKRYLVCAMLNIITKGEDNDGVGGPITDEQAAEIKDGLRETGLDVAKFLKTLKVESVEQILTRDLARARTAINAKRWENLQAEKKGKKDA